MVRFQVPCDERSFDLNMLPEPEADREMDIIEGGDQQFITFRKAVGYIFNPTDLELVLGYLKRFADGEALPQNKIHEADIYLYHPDTLAVEFEKANDKHFFFFTPRNKAARSANGGFWHSTTGKKEIYLRNTLIGERQNFTFFDGRPVNGKPPREGKTSWLMVEYRLAYVNKSSKTSSSSSIQIDYVLSKVYQTSDPVENKPEDYGDCIKQQQELAILHEKLWQGIQLGDEEQFPMRNRS